MKLLKLLLPLSALLFVVACDNTTEDPVYPKATNLYFSDYSGKQIGVMDVNTLNTYDVLANSGDGLDTVSGIAIDTEGGKIYAVEELKDRIIRFNIDGSGPIEVLFDAADSVNMPTAIALDVANNMLYWANSGSGQLKKGSMDGGAASSLNYAHKPILSYCYGLAIDADKKLVYYSDLGEYAGIWITTTATAGSTDARTPSIIFLQSTSGVPSFTLRNPSSIFLDETDGLIYWADEGLNTISVGSISTGSSRILYNYEDNVSRADGISVDKGSQKVYWTETEAGNLAICRGTLDGTGEREVILTGVEAYAIALKFENQ
jgi:DNA-binding beta-propeller fold protein YncE